MAEKLLKKDVFNLLIPNATVFISNFCIMVLELVAGRLIARHLGVSLYTWTGVIGIVLTGIAVGNYTGGRLADKFPPKKTLTWLFFISSAFCVLIPVIQNIVGEWQYLRFLSMPLHIIIYIMMIFFLPSAFMGMVSPVAAKMALDKKEKTGYTIGNIYTWGTIGCIAGTFLTGYYFIALFGTRAIIWSVAGILGLMGTLYGWRIRKFRIWIIVLIVCTIFANGPWKWAETAGLALGLRESKDPLLIYSDESQYTHIRISRIPGSPYVLKFNQDNLLHSKINIKNPLRLEYDYMKIFAVATHELDKNKKKLATLQIGGGGYVFPRFLEAAYPGSLIEVVEIDPAVTKAAMEAFGLQKDTSIKIHHMDGRDYINRLASQKDNKKKYDFIYIDAVNSYMVPWQITTLEFTEKINRMLLNDGVFIINLIDILDEARFLGPFINTIEEVFPHVYVLILGEDTPSAKYNSYQTIVMICTKKEFDPLNLIHKYKKYFTLSCLSESEINKIKKQSGGLILTDNYAPVESLLMKMVKKIDSRKKEKELLEKARAAYQQRDIKKAIRIYNKIISYFPNSGEGNNDMGIISTQIGRLDEAEKYFSRAIRINPERAILYNNLGFIFHKKGDINKAIECYLKALKLMPDSAKAYNNLGVLSCEEKNFKKALYYFSKALQLDPFNKNAQESLKKVRAELDIRN